MEIIECYLNQSRHGYPGHSGEKSEINGAPLTGCLTLRSRLTCTTIANFKVLTYENP